MERLGLSHGFHRSSILFDRHETPDVAGSQEHGLIAALSPFARPGYFFNPENQDEVVTFITENNGLFTRSQSESRLSSTPNSFAFRSQLGGLSKVERIGSGGRLQNFHVCVVNCTGVQSGQRTVLSLQQKKHSQPAFFRLKMQRICHLARLCLPAFQSIKIEEIDAIFREIEKHLVELGCELDHCGETVRELRNLGAKAVCICTGHPNFVVGLFLEKPSWLPQHFSRASDTIVSEVRFLSCQKSLPSS